MENIIFFYSQYRKIERTYRKKYFLNRFIRYTYLSVSLPINHNLNFPYCMLRRDSVIKSGRSLPLTGQICRLLRNAPPAGIETIRSKREKRLLGARGAEFTALVFLINNLNDLFISINGTRLEKAANSVKKVV